MIAADRNTSEGIKTAGRMTPKLLCVSLVKSGIVEVWIVDVLEVVEDAEVVVVGFTVRPVVLVVVVSSKTGTEKHLSLASDIQLLFENIFLPLFITDSLNSSTPKKTVALL